MGDYLPYLQAAKRDIQVGERDRARNTLASIATKDETCAEAWYLLASIEENDGYIVQFARKALFFKNDYPEAQKLLTDLQQRLCLQPIQVMVIPAGSTSAGKTCPYCLDQFQTQEQVIVCPKCRRIHHYYCWKENGCTCAGKFCDGFSIAELDAGPLLDLPDQIEDRLIIIRKEDIIPGAAAERQKREALFLLQLLISSFSAEQGLISQQSVFGLPSIDELIDLIKHSREAMRRSSQTASTSRAIRSGQTEVTAQATTISKFCLKCGMQFPRVESRFCSNCGTPRT